MIIPNRQDFLARTGEGNLIPIYRELIADMETPVSAFKKIADAPYAFLLESVEGGETIGRYSFVGANPQVIFRSKHDEVDIEHANGRRESFRDPQPLDRLRDLMQSYQFVSDPTLPPFCGGAVGYIGYDLIRKLEPIGDHVNDDLRLPDIFFMVTDTLLIFDHVHHRVRILANVHIDRHVDPNLAYDEAVKKINAIQGKLLKLPPRNDRTVTSREACLKSNMEPEEFQERVARCKEYIAAGDVFQVVLSQRFTTPISCDPFDVYRSLRIINPSPYMYYLKFDSLHIAGSSPEILVKLSGGQVQLRPIAGTRRRGESPATDAALEDELLADPKERAEHIMLVDLGRNDCGRVCEYGTVHVDDLMTIERYSHVMHIVSNVVGRLRPGLDAFDVLKATFPAGTVSGAPKIRAMQIINELEPVSRGPYAGTVGYFSFNGNLDSCITIRTIVMADEHAHVQAGAGIVADSIPANEHQECVNKARAMVRAIEMAETGLE